MTYWKRFYWGAGVLCFAATWLTGWGPQPSSSNELLTALATSAAEMLLVWACLVPARFALAGKLVALVAVSVATGVWAAQATPSGAGVEVAHVLWLMLLVVILAGSLGWDLFSQVLERDRSAR